MANGKTRRKQSKGLVSLALVLFVKPGRKDRDDSRWMECMGLVVSRGQGFAGLKTKGKNWFECFSKG